MRKHISKFRQNIKAKLQGSSVPFADLVEGAGGITGLRSHAQAKRVEAWPPREEPADISFVAVSGSMSSSNTTTASVSLPTGTQAGDFCVVGVFLDQTSVAVTTPTGWTLIGNGNTSEYPRSFVYGRIIQSGDTGFSATQDSEANMIIAGSFRKANGITSFTSRNFANDKGVSSLSASLSSTNATVPTIAIAMMAGRTTQSPTMTWSGATVETDTTTGGTRSLGYVIYNDGTPASHTVTSNDTGRQSLSVFYIDLE
jgi:hypothetical protein